MRAKLTSSSHGGRKAPGLGASGGVHRQAAAGLRTLLGANALAVRFEAIRSFACQRRHGTDRNAATGAVPNLGGRRCLARARVPQRPVSTTTSDTGMKGE